MKEVVVDDSTKRLSYSAGKLIVKNQDSQVEMQIAIKNIKSVLLFGNPQVTT